MCGLASPPGLLKGHDAGACSWRKLKTINVAEMKEFREVHCLAGIPLTLTLLHGRKSGGPSLRHNWVTLDSTTSPTFFFYI